jgi:hypothetical protein
MSNPLLPELSFLFINSFLIFGIFYCFAFQAEYNHAKDKWDFLGDDSNVFGWFHFMLRKPLSEYWCRPIFGCVVCMASVWGTIFYCLFAHDLNIQSWLVQLVAVAGINSLLKQWL